MLAGIANLDREVQYVNRDQLDLDIRVEKKKIAICLFCLLYIFIFDIFFVADIILFMLLIGQKLNFDRNVNMTLWFCLINSEEKKLHGASHL